MTSLISGEVTVAEEGAPAEAPTVVTSPSSLISSEVTVAEAPAPPTAPEGRPWGFLVALGALLGILIVTRRRKREEEERR